MTLWTIQPEELYHSILETGIYICEPERSSVDDLKEMYDWLVSEMKVRIGEPPEGVLYPVWAWHTQKSKHKKPDLRSERWANGKDGDKYVCMEIEIPDDQVLLSDYDLWSLVLLNTLITKTEEEDAELDRKYQALSPDKQLEMKYENWKRVFDTTPMDTGWMRQGEWIQATFWILTKDMIKKVWHFTTAERKY